MTGSGTAAAGACPFEVVRPIMTQRWERLTFLHWRIDPAPVQRLLPRGLTVESCDDTAWIGLVPFVMDVGTSGGRQLPWISRFCETNLRTYVRDAAGRSGIFSLDAARLPAVVAARATYRVPYFWSSMRLADAGDSVTYTCRRRFARSRPRSRVVVRPGPAYAADELGPLDHFLTARWMLFSVWARRLLLARVEHAPWPLHRAALLELDDDLVRAAGLPEPEGAPLVHFSPGVDARIGMPERATGRPV